MDLNAAYFTRKYTVFKHCGGWSHCDKGHVWRINGNLVFPRILSLPLNERSLFLVNKLQIRTNQSKGFKMTLVTLSVLAADWLNVGEGNQLCSFLSVSLRWCKHEYQAKKTTTSTFKSKNAANIPYDGENGEPVQLITEFFIDEAISNVEEGARLIGGADLTRATAETNWKTQPHKWRCAERTAV